MFADIILVLINNNKCLRCKYLSLQVAAMVSVISCFQDKTPLETTRLLMEIEQGTPTSVCIGSVTQEVKVFYDSLRPTVGLTHFMHEQ